MYISVKIVLLVSLLAISYQDFKERKVYLWLLITSGILLGYIYYSTVRLEIFLINIVINFGVVLLILLLLSLYSKYKIKKPFLQSMGLGDMLLFFVMSMGFPIFTFLMLFVFSIFFVSFVHIIINTIQKKNDIIAPDTPHHRLVTHKNQIPLAGLQALFLVFIFLVNWSFQITNLYLL